ncbi:hypothetical protein [Spirochaeta africana]|uniref:Uncharacterized protein n=1 Tax=Spirochaeta africana (strain ATCC 700263 / DSM 8902 / Z-7692) TaxID=889378 RepID=H9UFI1_SPIAZ|nr:hypothetical protein [Spirochaeta africana]AFG36274.1 hypothetical protein Spiaf_0165 [Spirochaeta africana DSM 8902]
MIGNLDILSRRAGFNTALRHFKAVSGFLKPVSSGANLADLLADALENGVLSEEQVPLVVSALLADKFSYAAVSRNAEVIIEDVDAVIEKLCGWSALQIVVVYEHPEAGSFAINPCRKESWKQALPILRDELVVVYVGPASGELPAEVLQAAAYDVHEILAGREPAGRPEYTATTARRPAPPPKPKVAKQPAAARKGDYRITPRYSVVVTNELFHNGNVEAWKRIVGSYRATYPELDVLIYYDNERIKDINSLFKWGKVKHGTPILISVAGDQIRDVSKLQRYLFEGASPRFEMFLKGSIDQPLELF